MIRSVTAMAVIPLAIAGLFLLPARAAPPSAGTGRAFTPGGRETHDLAGGQSHTYVVPLRAGEFQRLTVVQDGIDVLAVVVGPDGSRLEVDVATGHQGREPLSLLAAAAGRHRVTVRARHPGAVGGRYTIESEARRPPTDTDRRRLAAERALSSGVRLSRSHTAAGRREALLHFEESVQAWRALGDPYWEAETLLLAGAGHAALGNHPQAEEAVRGALPLWKALGDRAGEGRALHLVGHIRHARSDLAGAVSAWEEALAARRAIGDRWGTADTLGALGVAKGEMGKAEGLDVGREALALWRGLGDRQGESRALFHLGETLARRAEFEEALDLFLRALSIQRAAGDRGGEAGTLTNLAFVQQHLGDLDGGRAYLERVLPLWRELGDRGAEATTLNTLGYILARLGDLPSALRHYRRALELAGQIGDRGREAYLLVNIGHVLRVSGQPQEALDHQLRALALMREVGERPAEAVTLVNIGLSYAQMGRRQEAQEHYQRALDMRIALGQRTSQAVIHYFRARLAHESGERPRALGEIETALAIVEAERRRLSTVKLPGAHDATTQDMYELYVDVLMGLHGERPEEGHAARALYASEQARARALLELLHEARADIRQAVSPDLLEEERVLQDRLSARVQEQMRLAGAGRTEEQAKEAALAIQDLTLQVDNVRARLRAASPRYATVDQPDLLTLDRIQGELLDDETVLLEYSLGKERSYMWVVTRGSMTAHVLPARATVEAAAREAYAVLSRAPRGRRAPAGPSGAGDPLAALARMVLGPAADRLAARRILVVPDGALHYIPFGALPDPGPSGEPLLSRHEVLAVSSASVVAALRNERSRRSPAGKTLAVVADPVFDAADERVARARGAKAQGTGVRSGAHRRDVDRAARDLGVGTLARLPFTRKEAKTILALAPPAERMAALDFEASRATATDPSLADYRVVHFATHGFYNNVRPELSGLVLSLVDRRGEDERGFLTTADVFRLRLGAELVVLSGCRTALGREIKGEGLVGLTRGFMYAGATRVLASLWKVDDEATAALMEQFYREMLGPSHRSPADALRRAQASVRGVPRWRAPYYWAAFQVQGDWK
jgi:CHAT domain-containing protein/tetratricopeptide (TPR) repeat protein